MMSTASSVISNTLIETSLTALIQCLNTHRRPNSQMLCLESFPFYVWKVFATKEEKTSLYTVYSYLKWEQTSVYCFFVVVIVNIEKKKQHVVPSFINLKCIVPECWSGRFAQMNYMYKST